MVLTGEKSLLRPQRDPGLWAGGDGEAHAGRPDRDLPRLCIRTLGGFEVRRDGTRLGEECWGRPAASRLVRFLLVSGGAAAQEDVIDALWRNLNPDGARRSLQVAASLARKVLDGEGAGRSRLVLEAGAYSLELVQGDELDAVEFDAAAATALRCDGAERLLRLERARRLWTGEPLPGDSQSAWARPWRALLSDRYEAVLGALLEIRLERGEDDEVAALARRMLARSSLDERAHRALIVAYARMGRRDLALEQFRECRQRLAGELGIEPSRETVEAQRLALTGEAV